MFWVGPSALRKRQPSEILRAFIPTGTGAMTCGESWKKKISWSWKHMIFSPKFTKAESVIICPYFDRICKILILAQPRLFSEPWCFPTSQYGLHLKNLKLLLFISLQMGKWPTWWKTPQMWGKFSQQIVTLMISPHHRNKGIMKGWETSELFAEDEKKKIGFMFSNFEYGKMMSPSFPWATDLGCCH